MPALQAELAEHQAAIAKANAELEAAERRYEEITNPHAWECGRIQDELAAADRAKDSLAKSCLDPGPSASLPRPGRSYRARGKSGSPGNERQRKQEALRNVKVPWRPRSRFTRQTTGCGSGSDGTSRVDQTDRPRRTLTRRSASCAGGGAERSLVP